ncbi:hypothetical protein SAMN04488029_2786 [Reichenbachiella faecimaris]|uniref:Uncharacterized protein n=1 Tax=Reichenbachiella faecimaris TaxID=692418 RepID=A0A1W2GI33_REIFA|nr:DUF5995 family protein [Reichenbachiella faecimaris]SMD36231.1 hypothetical protein SAMN04488029_2786 [Reichenbachiella faecimaris]
MKESPIDTIDQVIISLDQIIQESIENESCAGYFAALYRKVTLKVKEGIEQDYFDNGPRMEHLDVVFATRYIHAYKAYKHGEPLTRSWQVAFALSTHYWPIVLQHLLIGMNAHINLDLGIAAAEISEGKNVNDLHGDFDKINEILSSLVHEVDRDLAEIWPTFRIIVKALGKVDDYLVDFSMKLARDGAWKFAKHLADTPLSLKPEMIIARDQKVSKKASLITSPGFLITIIFRWIRLGERGSIAKKIEDLKN